MSYRLSKIYTRKGDDGTTSLDGKNRILKNSQRIETVGTLDELNCTIGLVVSQKKINPDVYQTLTQIQHELFDLGGELCPPHRSAITAEHVRRLEKKIDEWNNTLEPLKEFVLPQGNFVSSACHLARAVCRRAERNLVALMQEEESSAEGLRYINRLSDLLFVAARILAKDEHCPEILWQHER